MGQSLSTGDAAAVLISLSDAVAERRAGIQQFSNEKCPESNDEAESESPMSETLDQYGGSQPVTSMAKFSAAEFMKIWDVIAEYTLRKWNVRRTKRCNTTAKDVLLVSLTVLKDGSHQDFLAKMFHIKGTSFQRIIVESTSPIAAEIYDMFVATMDDRYPMRSSLET